jgi:hypothetical protein
MAVNRQDQRVHRYKVVETWGDVPQDILDLVGVRGAYALDTYRGQVTQWELERRGEIIAGWAGTYAGISPGAVALVDGQEAVA